MTPEQKAEGALCEHGIALDDHPPDCLCIRTAHTYCVECEPSEQKAEGGERPEMLWEELQFCRRLLSEERTALQASREETRQAETKREWAERQFDELLVEIRRLREALRRQGDLAFSAFSRPPSINDRDDSRDKFRALAHLADDALASPAPEREAE